MKMIRRMPYMQYGRTIAGAGSRTSASTMLHKIMSCSWTRGWVISLQSERFGIYMWAARSWTMSVWRSNQDWGRR